MRFNANPKPAAQCGDVRKRRKFIWWPTLTTDGKTIVWLELVILTETFKELISTTDLGNELRYCKWVVTDVALTGRR